jgi:hypothetical protein
MAGGIRDHEPLVIEQFNGLWSRGDPESVPSDHFIVADNVQYFHSGVETRNPVNTYQTAGTILDNAIRVYNYVMQTGQSLLVLTTGGTIYHIKGTGTVFGPILNIPDMEDFGFVSIAGRAYISPFKSYLDDHNLWQEKGLPNEFVYVYGGDGTVAKKIGGAPPTNGGKQPMVAFNSFNEGVVTAGVHIIGIRYGDVGALAPNVLMVVNAIGGRMIQLMNIPLGTEPRVIYMTQKLDITADISAYRNYSYFRVGTIGNSQWDQELINVPDTALSTAISAGFSYPDNGAMIVDSLSSVRGHTDIGFHIVGVVYETDTGYLTAPGPEEFGQTTYVKTQNGVTITNIPIAPAGEHVVRRHLVSTKALPYFNGYDKGYQFFFIPDGTIEDNTTTSKTLSYYDADLVSDASHLSDNFAEVKAGVALNTYHGRLVLVGEYDNPSVARISVAGEPESFNQVDGLITAPLDGNPLTNAQEFRNILYLFKKTRTYAYNDNNDEPTSWMPEEVIDEAIGAPVHGIATVLDSGGVNIDYLLIADVSGLLMFNGTYARPELSWKIENYWFSLDRNEFRKIQIVHDSISKRIWMTQPAPYRNRILYADYSDSGLDAKGIKWARWPFDVDVTSLCLIEVSKLILGALNTSSLNGGILFMPTTAMSPTVSRIDKYYGAQQRKIPDPTIVTALLGD